jgi:mRNA-degrading endonuclease RelE of RelBE toxin-antitoxin system
VNSPACPGARRGTYRLLYRTDDETQKVNIVQVVHVDHRADGVAQ